MANSVSGDSVVDRVVRVIAAFPEGVSVLRLTELAERAELPLATAHRLVRQLAEHGLLEIRAGGSVRLGLHLWELVVRNPPTLALRQAAMPFMEDIQQVLNQNVNLAVLDGWEALFVERLSRRGSVANRAQIAGRLAVHVSSAGLALMSRQPRSRQGEYLAQFTDPAGKVSTDDLRSLLGEAASGIRAVGWCDRPRHVGNCGSYTGRQEAGGGRPRRRSSPAGGAPPGPRAGTANRRPGYRAAGWGSRKAARTSVQRNQCNADHTGPGTL